MIVRTVCRSAAPAAADMPVIARTILPATAVPTTLHRAAPADSTIARPTATAEAAATRNPIMGIAVLLSLFMATAIAETPSCAVIPRRQLPLVPTRLRPAPTPRLAAVLAAVAAGVMAVEAAEVRTCPVVEGRLVVVEAAAVTAAAVAATNQRTC